MVNDNSKVILLYLQIRIEELWLMIYLQEQTIDHWLLYNK